MGEVVHDLDIFEAFDSSSAAIEQFVEDKPRVESDFLPVLKKNKQRFLDTILQGWSVMIPVTSLHFGEGSKYNEFNPGLGLQKRISQIGRHSFSFSFGAYVNSYHGTSNRVRENDDAPTVTPYTFLDYSYSLVSEVSCGASFGLVDYHGNMPSTHISEETTIGLAGQLFCDFGLAGNWSAQVGLVPANSFDPNTSDIGTLSLKYSFD